MEVHLRDRDRLADSDSIAVGLFAGEERRSELPAPVRQLIERGEASGQLRRLALTHDGEGRRWLAVGFGPADEASSDRIRAAAGAVVGRVRELHGRHLAWDVGGSLQDASVSAVVDGCRQANYRYEAVRRKPGEDDRPRLSTLTVVGPRSLEKVIERACIVAEGVELARELQNTPPNLLTPAALAKQAELLTTGQEALTADVLGLDDLERLGMGALLSVAKGSAEPARVIILRYEPVGVEGPLLGLVGKGLTFDAGGLALKPGPLMSELKFDMSGAASVLSAVRVASALELPVRILCVVGAAENLPDGGATRPGDVVTALDGSTVEVMNPDAEGRLVIADCLTYAIRLGAEQLITVATLGGYPEALGTSYGALFATDADLANDLAAAGTRSGEPLWRLPLAREFDKLLASAVADLRNHVDEQAHGPWVGPAFLKHFTEGCPWAHLEFAHLAADSGARWNGASGRGWGVRLLAEYLSRASQTR